MGDEKNIVMDIAYGNGQSSEPFDKMKGCSFILIEPDREKWLLLKKRLGVNKISDNPRSLIPEIQNLKTGTTKYHILNTTLQNVLYDKPCVNNIKGAV